MYIFGATKDNFDRESLIIPQVKLHVRIFERYRTVRKFDIE